MKKKVKRMTAGLIVMAILIIALAAALVYNRNALKEERAVTDAYAAEMLANQQTVYTATADIRHGDTVQEGVNVELQNVYTGLSKGVYMTAEELGSTAIIDIPLGVTVMKEMVTPVTIAKDTREYEIQVARLMQDQVENDYVDIRIMFPNGVDQLVLPKKQIKNLNLENCVFWSYLNEEEILRLSSAIIDAYSITGTRIYATRYVESNLQDEALPTYLVNTNVQDMFDTTSAYYDGNLLSKAIQTLNADARLDMERKLKNLTSEKLAAVAAGHALEDTAKNSALTGSGDYDAQQAAELDETSPYFSSGAGTSTVPTTDMTEEEPADAASEASTTQETSTQTESSLTTSATQNALDQITSETTGN